MTGSMLNVMASSCGEEVERHLWILKGIYDDGSKVTRIAKRTRQFFPFDIKKRNKNEKKEGKYAIRSLSYSLDRPFFSSNAFGVHREKAWAFKKQRNRERG